MASIIGPSAWVPAKYPAAAAVTAAPPASHASADARLRRAAHSSSGTATHPTEGVAHAAAAPSEPDSSHSLRLPLRWGGPPDQTAAVASAALSQRCFTTS